MATIKHFVRVAKIEKELQKLIENDEALDQAYQAAQGIKYICQDNKIRLHVFMYTDLKSDFSQSVWDFNLQVFPDMKRFSDKVYKHKISFIDSHPNPEGHKFMAQEINAVLDTVVQSKLIRFYP
jgi:hypothetical protein